MTEGNPFGAGDPREALRRLLVDPAASFAIGVPAASAEFLRAADEPWEVAGDGLGAATPRGAIRVAWRDNARPLAYETLSRHPGRWLHGLLFCLPAAAAHLGGRKALTELGPDGGAVRAEDRAALLFDLGVGARHVDFCVRTDDPALIARLRAHCGTPLDGWPAELMGALLAANPARVVTSALARIEVSAPIPRERTPLGPHTHLFPERLAANLTHDPKTPVPEDWRACLEVYPPHPAIGLEGETTAFDTARHEAFQALLRAWGDPAYLAAKARAEAGEEADARNPAAALAVEIAHRQARAGSP